MPYTIPSDIRYEEKFLGPFTIKQSIYVLIAAAIIFYLLIIDQTLQVTLKVIIILLVGGLTMGLVMFNLEVIVKDYVSFLREQKEASWITPSARRLMNIKAIRANAVFLKDGNVLGVVKVKPINFGVLSKEDQDAVVYGFLEFLNAINFPIQIVMRSVNLDLSNYLAALKRNILQRDDKIALAYYEHFSGYMYDYIKTNKINDRLFYIIASVRMQTDERETIRRLESRCRTIIDTLSLSGIIGERLNTNQLLSLYSSYFTEYFHVNEDFISPVTMYKKMWREAPKATVASSMSSIDQEDTK